MSRCLSSLWTKFNSELWGSIPREFFPCRSHSANLSRANMIEKDGCLHRILLHRCHFFSLEQACFDWVTAGLTRLFLEPVQNLDVTLLASEVPKFQQQFCVPRASVGSSTSSALPHTQHGINM